MVGLYVMAVTAFFVIAYVPFVVSFTIMINSAIDAYHGGVAVAAAAATGQRHRVVLAERMSPATMAMLVLFWAVLGVACYRYSGCYQIAADRDNVGQQPAQQSTAVAKRKSSSFFFYNYFFVFSPYELSYLVLYLVTHSRLGLRGDFRVRVRMLPTGPVLIIGGIKRLFFFLF